jgi:hypothetical protein
MTTHHDRSHDEPTVQTRPSVDHDPMPLGPKASSTRGECAFRSVLGRAGREAPTSRCNTGDFGRFCSLSELCRGPDR